jgi:iron complex transport system substrate-binding protein
MKIISLLPAATEIVYLLGLQKSLVGISFDSDFPASIVGLPKVSSTVIPPDLSSKAIDRLVRKSKHQGQSIFHIDEKLLTELQPDIILTQELCPVCAPSFSNVQKAARILHADTMIISLEPHSISDVFMNMRTVAEYTGSREKAERIIGLLQKRLDTVQSKVSSIKIKPTVAVIEWFDPIMIAAHWVPEMVELAGGDNLFAKPGEKSREIEWEKIVTADPEVIILAPCGFSIERAEKEINLFTKRKGFKNVRALKSKNIYYVDGNAYMTRPGPRIIDGVEILTEILHPEVFERKYNNIDWRSCTI